MITKTTGGVPIMALAHSETLNETMEIAKYFMIVNTVWASEHEVKVKPPLIWR